MKYTKGKWEIPKSESLKGNISIIQNGDWIKGCWIATVQGPNVGPAEDEVIGNAKLISKAPEMYEALKKIISIQDIMDKDDIISLVEEQIRQVES